MMRPDLEVAAVIFARAVARGELPADTDVHAMAEIMAGTMFAHHILYGEQRPGFHQVLATTLAKLGG